MASYGKWSLLIKREEEGVLLQEWSFSIPRINFLHTSIIFHFFKHLHNCIGQYYIQFVNMWLKMIISRIPLPPDTHDTWTVEQSSCWDPDWGTFCLASMKITLTLQSIAVCSWLNPWHINGSIFCKSPWQCKVLETWITSTRLKCVSVIHETDWHHQSNWNPLFTKH